MSQRATIYCFVEGEMDAVLIFWISLHRSNIQDMNFEGIIVGLATFLIIGLFHPIVIKAEYHIGKKCWWVFLIVGIGFAAASLFINSLIWSTITGVTAFSCFWSIHELIEQEKRVDRGWFPKNPKKGRQA